MSSNPEWDNLENKRFRFIFAALPVRRILLSNDVAGRFLYQPVAAAVVEKAVVVEFPFALIQNLDAAFFVVMNIAVNKRRRSVVGNKDSARLAEANLAILKPSLRAENAHHAGLTRMMEDAVCYSRFRAFRNDHGGVRRVEDFARLHLSAASVVKHDADARRFVNLAVNQLRRAVDAQKLNRHVVVNIAMFESTDAVVPNADAVFLIMVHLAGFADAVALVFDFKSG